MIAAGERLPDVRVWLAPSSDPIALAALLEDGPILLFFYLYDWSST